MPKKVVPLTFAQVHHARAQSKSYRLADGDGLFLVVRPTGNKVWELRVTKKGKTTTIYQSFEHFSLKEAREWRAEVRTRADKNLPLTDKDVALFQDVFDQWFAKWHSEVNEKYAKQINATVQLNIMPHLGNMSVKDIRPVNIVNSLQGMEKRGVLEYLKRTKTGIKLALDFAVSRGLIDINPALAVTPNAFKKHKSTNFRALTPDELPNLIQAIEKAKLTEKITLQTYCLIYFQLITMARPAEAASAEWEDIDGNIWIIPAAKIKARRDHRVPLPEMLMKILDFLRPLNQGSYIFAGDSDGHISKDTVRAAFARLDINSTAHGLRALARTYLEETGKFRHNALELCLAHKVGSDTENAYNRTDYFEERREILNFWAEDVSKLRQNCSPF